jgi:putative endonuclease
LTNQNRTVLYTGVTSSLAARVFEHAEGRGGSFTSRYKASKLAYFEAFADVTEAIRREKQIKAGSRTKKVALINAFNPGWLDLIEDVL